MDMPTMQTAEELNFSFLKIYFDRHFSGCKYGFDLITALCKDLSKLLMESRQGCQRSLALRMDNFHWSLDSLGRKMSKVLTSSKYCLASSTPFFLAKSLFPDHGIFQKCHFALVLLRKNSKNFQFHRIFHISQLLFWIKMVNKLKMGKLLSVCVVHILFCQSRNLMKSWFYHWNLETYYYCTLFLLPWVMKLVHAAARALACSTTVTLPLYILKIIT